MTNSIVPEVFLGERRHYPRARADVAGQIVFSDEYVCDCAIANASVGGFSLRVERGQWIPGSFLLASALNAEPIKVVVEWRAADSVGVRISSSG